MECPKCDGPMWDNRRTKRGNQPDYKCKDCGWAVWLNEDEDGGGDAPPPRRSSSRSNGYSKPRRSNGSRSNGSTSKDDYWQRKEENDLIAQQRMGRAHSQEMALRYIEIKGMEMPEPEKLKALISWFQRDLDNAAVAKAKPAPEPEPEPAPTGDDDGFDL